MKIEKKQGKREFVLKGFFFLLGLLICLVALSNVLKPKNNTKTGGTINYQAKAIYSERKNSIDVLAIGASNFWCGYTPMQVWKNEGFTSYNCGTLMQQIWYTYYFLEDIYKRQTPKVVLLDADIFFIEDSTSVENVNDMIRNTLYWKLPIVEYHNRWKSLTPRDFDSKVKNTYHDEMKGFYYVNYKQSYLKNDYMNQHFQNEKVTLLDRIFMEKIIRLCREHNTKIVLVEAPAECTWNYKRHHEIAKYAREKKIDFMDANEKNIGIDWNEDSRDGGYHLNYSGATKFTSFIEAYLVKNKKLKDHRKDLEYAKWAEDLVKYDQVVSGK